MRSIVLTFIFLVFASCGSRVNRIWDGRREAVMEYEPVASQAFPRHGHSQSSILEPYKAMAVLLLANSSTAWQAPSASVGQRFPVPARGSGEKARRRASSVLMAQSAETAIQSGSPQLVWFTGAGDLRIRDHGGLSAASASDSNCVIPFFNFDPDVHFRYPPSRLALLHTALTSLETELRERYGLPLIVRSGSAKELLPKMTQLSGAAVVHVVADDVEKHMRSAQRAGCAALEASGVFCERWDAGLRAIPSDTSIQDPKTVPLRALSTLPGEFTEYVEAVSGLPFQKPLNAPDKIHFDPDIFKQLSGEGVMPLQDLLSEAAKKYPEDRGAMESTVQPYDDFARSMGEERLALSNLKSYLQQGRDAFADATFADAIPSDSGKAPSLHAAAAQRLIDGASRPSEVLALREASARAFAPALAVGSLSPRAVRQAAAVAGASFNALGEDPWWGRSGEDALADTVEWREWFQLLASRSLARQEAELGGTSGQERQQTGDARIAGEVAYWRWGGQYLVRYLRWGAGPAYSGKTPAILFLHGFAASAEQWERLVFQLREQATREGTPAEELPPMYAMDLIGFGHSEKPGISYTQYVWEAQVVDFVREVMGSRDVILVGNSIGGGLSAGASATLGETCKGLVLCNTAGVLLDLDDVQAEASQVNSVEEETLAGTGKPYAPVPLLGQPALDLFGKAIISFIYPQIEPRLKDIYSDRPANADPAVTYAIQQGASSPGSANVIGSGQKLAANRPLNDVLALDGVSTSGFCGPVLVAQGVNDRVSGPERAQARADQFSKMRDTVTVERIIGGHCPQDDAPDAVAQAMLRWLPEVRKWMSRGK